jgi:hypothetical protein
MRSRKIQQIVGGAAVLLGASCGCGADPAGETDLAKLPPPPQAIVDRAKAAPVPKAPPKFGSPPKSQMVVPQQQQ